MAKKIQWINRYSDTIENDRFGRWGIMGNAGDFNRMFGFKDGKPCWFEISWIKKLEDPVTKEFLNKFYVIPLFPYKGRTIFDTIEEAKAEVEKYFDWFIKCTK